MWNTDWQRGPSGLHTGRHTIRYRQMDRRTDKQTKISKHQGRHISWPAKDTNRQPDSERIQGSQTDAQIYSQMHRHADRCRQTWSQWDTTHRADRSLDFAPLPPDVGLSCDQFALHALHIGSSSRGGLPCLKPCT